MRELTVDGYTINDDNDCYVIAEIGGNSGRPIPGSDTMDADLLGGIAIELIDARAAKGPAKKRKRKAPAKKKATAKK